MLGLRRFITAQRAALGILAIIVLVAIAVIVIDATSVPNTAIIAPSSSPTAPVSTAVPWTGRVIGVMAVPVAWRTLHTATLPFSIGYPPDWHIQRLSTGATPTVVLAESARHRTVTISGRRLNSAGQATDALAAPAFAPVPGTRDPAVFYHLNRYVPHKGEGTSILAFARAGYLWTVRMEQQPDVHVIEGLHALQTMLATFHTQ